MDIAAGVEVLDWLTHMHGRNGAMFLRPDTVCGGAWKKFRELHPNLVVRRAGNVVVVMWGLVSF